MMGLRAAKDDAVTAPAAETPAEGETLEEIRLITEETQLIYEYIDEEYENGIDDENEDGIDDGYFVYAEFGADAKLPEGVELRAEEITRESDPETYEAYYEKALSGLQDKYDENTALSFARFYDIRFVYNGEEVEPSGDVKVRIEYKKAVEIKKETNVDAVHFDRNNDEEPEVIDSEVNKPDSSFSKDSRSEDSKSEAEETGEDDTVKTVDFESAQFSVYGIIGSYTVDFHWEVDGKKFEFSIPGGGFVSFEHLVDVLGIGASDPKASENDENDAEEAAENAGEEQETSGTYDEAIRLNESEVSEAARKFVADVESVEFSDPELVWVGKADDAATVGELKEANGLEAEYSAELTEEQIEAVNAQIVEAGDWALISIKPFDTEETLTVTMSNGEVFEITVTDVSYKATKVTELDGKTAALLNITNKNALLSVAHSQAGRLSATGIQLSGTKLTSDQMLTPWTFSLVPETEDHYYIHASNGYMNIDNSSLTVSSEPQELVVQQKSNGTIRIKHAESDYAVNNYGNSTGNGYSAYADGGDSNRGEWFTLYEINEPSYAHVTVHYVDRYGTALTDVQYDGDNPLVVRNADGTFTIPYDWSGGMTTDTSIDLRADFSKKSYTYASTHLDGVDASNTHLEHEGYVIDSELTRNGTDLQFKSDSGRTSGSPIGNLAYKELTSFSLSGEVKAKPANKGSRITYAAKGNKDIYVILDPPPKSIPEGTVPGSGVTEPETPDLTKEMEENGDGTYTLSLTVDAHANSASDTNKANILFVVDTSSSMRAITSSNKRNRIMDTHDAVKELGDKFLLYNNSKPGAVQISMLTFDGSVDERLKWTDSTTEFDTAVDTYLKYKYLHTGTDWEDAMEEALYKVKHPVDDDPMFVIFFTDGEPSQYKNFHGKGKNTHQDPTSPGTYSEDVSGAYGDFFSYFLSRESSKDEMRAIVDAGAELFGIYAYNSTDEGYTGYNGKEDGALMLHNAVKYGYNTDDNLKEKFFFEAKDTTSLQKAFAAIFKSITESIGFTNVVVTDGISTDVTSSTVVNGDVTAFTYIIRDKFGAVDYKVTVAPNGVPEGTSVEAGTPMFTIGSGTPEAGIKKEITVSKIVTENGVPVPDEDGKIQTEDVSVEVYYYEKDGKEYIMPIATPAQTVEWDLSPLGVLKDGYSYEVNFVVWPNQASYDLVADLNNGIKPEGVTENWEGLTPHTDSKGRIYRVGGISGHEYIALYEDGTYAALSNTEQKVEYYKIDTTIVNGEEVTEYSGPTTETVDPPDPMRLEATASQIEKVWNVERDPGILAQLLYDTEGKPTKYHIDFDILQGSNTEPYVTIGLGWDEEAGEYKWQPGSVRYVTYNKHRVAVGMRWSSDFAIATGLMLSETKMKARGLNPANYTAVRYGQETYYILETGHDYKISEPGLSYDFDFESPLYHPMLVDNVLRNVELKDNEGTLEIVSMTPAGQTLSALKIENTLRGYIHINKIVVGPDGETVIEDDETKFTYLVELENDTDPGPFVEEHIPWYGINSMFYHTVYTDESGEEHFEYYQAEPTTEGHLNLTDEHGNTYDAVVADGSDFNKDIVGPTEIRFTVGEDEEKVIQLYGNQMDCADQNYASVEFQITRSQTLNIANVPVGTKFTVTESAERGYQYVGIATNVEDAVITNPQLKIEGDIVPDSDNNIKYTNKAVLGDLMLKKRVTVNRTPTDTTLSDGTYVLNVAGKADTATAGKSYTIKITVVNGVAASATIRDNTAEEPADTPATLDNGAVSLLNLTPGEYTVTEDEDSKTICTLVSSSKASDGQGSTETRSITVNVAAGTSNVTLVTFVNDCVRVGIDILKVNKENRQDHLPGAVFTITKLDDAASKSGHIVYKMKEGSTTEYEFTAQSEPTASEGPGKGTTSFSGLSNGYYEIKETQMPAGFVMTGDETVYIKIDNYIASYLAVPSEENTPITDWAVITETSTDDVIQIITSGAADDPATSEDEMVNTALSIGNTPGKELPSTGGAGTGLIYLLGVMLIGVAGAGMVVRRKRM